MAMQGDPNKNYMFFHHPVRPSCDATTGSSAAAAGGASTSSSTGGAVGRVDLKDQSDEFFMYIYKVERCSNWRHDWNECPYAHQGEKARRRDLTKYRYSGSACPKFWQRGKCPRGQGCKYAHGVFELWLHPTRYRTRMCRYGNACTRRVCFFAHTREQQRREVFGDCF